MDTGISNKDKSYFKRNEDGSIAGKGKEINFKHCKHKQVKYNKEKSALICDCGAGWEGERLDELYNLLVK